MIDSIRLSGPRLLGVVLFVLMAAVGYAQPPPIDEIRVNGAIPFSEATAKKMVALRVRDPFSPESAQAAADRLRTGCRNHDYPMATVKWRAEQPTGRRGMVLVFDAHVGPRGKLREVRFTGQRAVSASSLQSVLKVLPSKGGVAEFLKGQDVLQVEGLVADQQALLEHYRQLGHADAEMGPAVLEWVKALNGFRVTWPVIKEGPCYTIGFIRFSTEEVPDTKALNDIMRLNVGDRFDPNKVESARQRLEEHYRSAGHAFAEVRFEATRHTEAARVDLLFLVNPGLKPRLRAVRLTGNKQTDDFIIQREIPLHTGDRFDHVALQLSQARLSALPFFSEVKVEYQGGPTSPEFDVNVSVRERKSGRFEVGYVYGDREEGAVQLNIIENNLALLPPFRGKALQGRVGATVGSRIMRFEAGVFNPRVQSSDWNVDASAFYEDNKYVSEWYNQLSLGGSLMAGHPIGRHHMVSTGYAYTDYDIYNMDPLYAAALPSTGTDLCLTSWVLAWNMDRTDRVFRPTRGVRARSNVRIGSEALGGDTEVVQTSLDATGYVNPVGEHVLSLRAAMKSVDPYGSTDSVALPLRLFLGGANDLRGFEYRSVSPRDDSLRAVGGTSAWWSTLEYLLPAGRRIDFALYLDVGDVSEDPYEFSGEGPVSNWGVGILLRAENFPVRFDAAVPIETLEDDPDNKPGEVHFSFSVGYRF